MRRYVLDGSNLGHSGRTESPSLEQLLAAIKSLTDEFPSAQVSACVDANFMYRIPRDEARNLRAALADNVIIPAPAGTLGGGDRWVCAVADRARRAGEDVVVVTNDNFQELHIEYPWLLEEGNVMGGQHVPGLGWVWAVRAVARPSTLRQAAGYKRLESLSLPDDTSPDDLLIDPPVTSDTQKGVPTTEQAGPSLSSAETVESNADVDNVRLPLMGEVVEASITGLVSYGAFASVADRYNGLIHKSNLSELGDKPASEVVAKGDRVFVVVTGHAEHGRLALSLIDAIPAPVEFEANVYGVNADYDENGDYIYPEGFDPDADAWMEGYDSARIAWETSYSLAHAKWLRHQQWAAARSHISTHNIPPGDATAEPADEGT